MKNQSEFRAVDQIEWTPTDSPAAKQRLLSHDPDDPIILTRILQWEPGYDSSEAGVITHDYIEEVYLLEGAHEDLQLGQTFTAGMYASRQPGMPHGPYRSTTGCLMLEIRSPANPKPTHPEPHPGRTL